MAGDIVAVTERLADILGDRCALIGGMAVSAWGHIRATQDIDFISRASSSEILELLKEQKVVANVTHGNITEGDLEWVVRGELESVHFDILAPPVEIDWEACTEVELSLKTSIRLVGLSDLIRLKLKAGGNRDLWDVAKLVQLHPELRTFAEEQAVRFHVDRNLKSWFEDPRL